MLSPAPKTILRPDRLGPKGDGICDGPKGTIYVERAAPFDRLRIKVFKDSFGIKRGEILEILEPSPYRQKSSCPHYNQCGNCTLLHLKTDFYKSWKVETVKQAFFKVGIKPEVWLPPIFLKGHNRRRATLTLLKRRGKMVMGYYKRRSQDLTEIETCEIADPRILEFKKFLRPYLPFLAGEREPIDFFVQLAGENIDLVLKGPVGKTGRPDAAFKKLLKDIFEVSKVARISWRDGERIHILLQNSPVEMNFDGLKVNLPPGAFLQPTLDGQNELVQAVMKALPDSGKFADLFSGCGTFTGPMLQKGSIEAFESDPQAVKALTEASKNQKLNVYRRDLFTNPVLHKDLNTFDAIVFDPPRAGCSEQAQEMALSKCPILIGVSCNPATFARDSKILIKGGYQLKSLQVVDQFLGSHHVEVVGVFKKSK